MYCLGMMCKEWVFLWFCSGCTNSRTVILCFLSNVTEFDDYAEIVDDDPDYAHPMAGRVMNLVKTASLLHLNRVPLI